MRRALAAVAAILGTLALFAGDPAVVPREVKATELAMWIMTRKPNLRVLDVRSQQQFAAGHVAGSRLFSESLVDRNATIVFVTDGAMPRDIRVSKDMYVLKGGYRAWHDEVLNAARPTPLTNYFGGVRRGGC